MSAEGWETAGLREMLDHVTGRVSVRKLDLFNCWCCQVLRPYLTDRRSIAAARFAAQHVDEGSEDSPERAAVLAAARQAVDDLTNWKNAAPTGAEMRRRRVYLYATLVAQQAVGNKSPNRGVFQNAQITAYVFAWANDDRSATHLECSPLGEGLRELQLHVQESIFRDIVGNPFQPVQFEARWRTSDVLDLARGIYDDHLYSRLPILADALMDAGCEDEQIIGHCRGHGPHVRGCWVVDRVLSKE